MRVVDVTCASVGREGKEEECMERGDKGVERDKGGWVKGGVVEENRWRDIDELGKGKFAAEVRSRIRGKGQGGGVRGVRKRFQGAEEGVSDVAEGVF